MSENLNYKKGMLEFIKLLLQYSHEERLIDINRSLLAQDLYFDVLSLYNYILFNYSEHNNFSINIITISTFKKFIHTDLEIIINDEILSKFYDFYSLQNINSNNDTEKYLEYVQFADIFYPRYNYLLRRFLLERNGLNKNYKKLNDITKILLKKLFLKEIHMIEYLIFSLSNNIKINIRDIFKIISNNKIIITKQDLRKFFNLNRYNNHNNNKNNIIEGITEENFINIFDNVNINNNSSLIFTFKDVITNDNKNKNLLWLSIIESIIQLEKRIEESKILIISRNDFNLDLIMALFKKENKENDENDVKIELNNFLDKLNINISLNNLEKKLLLKRIDLTRKGFINKNEIYDFFTPYNKIYRAKLVINTLNNNEEINNESNLNLNISKGTMIYINNLINVIIKGEKEINLKKIELNADNKFIENIFDEIININIPKEDNNLIIDTINENNNKNIYIDYFNKEQLYKYLTDKLNIKITDNDFNLFFDRFDKLKRGKIKILELSDEMGYIL